jgi:drug/metabolite transporter (DMT)-like permease
MLVSSFLFGVMAAGARLASARIPGPQIAFVRFAVGSLAVLAVVFAGRAVIRPRRWAWLIVRGAAGGLAVLLYFSCIEHAGVAVATLLNYTAPVWSIQLGWWLLGERPPASAAVALALTLAGVSLVVAPAVTDLRPGVWELAGLASAVLSGVAVTSIRAARRRGSDGVYEGAWTVFGSFTFFGLVATLPAAIGPLGRWVVPSLSEWTILLGVGLVSVIAQIIMTVSLQHVTVATSGIIHQFTVVVAFSAGVFLFGEPLTASLGLGSVLILSGVLWAARSAGPAPT